MRLSLRNKNESATSEINSPNKHKVMGLINKLITHARKNLNSKQYCRVDPKISQLPYNFFSDVYTDGQKYIHKYIAIFN